jgi:hypothetical protein
VSNPNIEDAWHEGWIASYSISMGLEEVYPPALSLIAEGTSARRTCMLNLIVPPSVAPSTSSKTHPSPSLRLLSSAKPRHPASSRWIWRPPVNRISQDRPHHVSVAGAVLDGRNGASDLATTCRRHSKCRSVKQSCGSIQKFGSRNLTVSVALPLLPPGRRS